MIQPRAAYFTEPALLLLPCRSRTRPVRHVRLRVRSEVHAGGGEHRAETVGGCRLLRGEVSRVRKEGIGIVRGACTHLHSVKAGVSVSCMMDSPW